MTISQVSRGFNISTRTLRYYEQIGLLQSCKKEVNGQLNKLQDNDVRIVHVPPFTVAAAHYIGEEPELHCGQILQQFVRESGLYEIKRDARVFGFNHPNPSEGNPYGYELWVTIPDDMDVPVPLSRKRVKGGLYAAHQIMLGSISIICIGCI